MSDVFAAIREYDDAEERALRPVVLPLCERHGYGRMMQLISEWWREKDPVGAISLGPCYGTLEHERRRAEAARPKRRVKRKAARRVR